MSGGPFRAAGVGFLVDVVAAEVGPKLSSSPMDTIPIQAVSYRWPELITFLKNKWD